MKSYVAATSLALLVPACGTTVASPSLSSAAAETPPSMTAPVLEDIIFAGPPPVATVPGEVVETRATGAVDWSGNSVRATGTGVVDPGNPNTAQARLMAERAAVVVAQRNLLELAEGVRVDSETRVENFMTDYDVVMTTVHGFVRNARQVGPARYDSGTGTVEVELEMRIYGAEGLSGAISNALATPQLSPGTVSPEVRSFLEQYSGLVIDGARTGLTPSMFPRIFDEQGNLLLDTSQYASLLGTAEGAGLQFISDLEGLLGQPGLSGSPLVLRAVQAAGAFGSDIIVSTAGEDGGNLLKQALPYLLSAGRFLLRVVL